jgi:excisionase family DNA binding protein
LDGKFDIANDNAMNDLLTARQVQDILKVDRITVYRMLKDGRLKGVKIGQQWRFHLAEVERLIGMNLPKESPAEVAPDPNFPAHCVQTIQDLFAEVSQISAVVINMQGSPLTEISHPTRFCQMLMASAGGKNACLASWQGFARDSQAVNGVIGVKFFTCQAGLQYVGSPIFDKETQIGLFLAGQFYWRPPDPREEAERIRRLCAVSNLQPDELQSAASEIPSIEPALHARVEAWPFTAARAIQSILHERLDFMNRLQQIATLTQIS